MSRPWVRLVEVVVGATVGGLVALAVFVPQLTASRLDLGRADAERRILQDRCVIYVDGSASCPAGTFDAGGAK